MCLTWISMQKILTEAAAHWCWTQKANLSRIGGVYACILRTQETETGGPLASRPAWSTGWVLGQPGLRSETMPQEKKIWSLFCWFFANLEFLFNLCRMSEINWLRSYGPLTWIEILKPLFFLPSCTYSLESDELVLLKWIWLLEKSGFPIIHYWKTLKCFKTAWTYESL